MSQNNNPRPRRLPASVYRRRRITVLGMAVVVLALFTVGIVLLVQAVTGGGKASPEAKQQEQSQTGGDAQKQGSQNVPGPGEASGKCPTEAVVVSAATDKKSYKPNSVIKLELAVTNKHDASCAIDVGAKQQTFTVKKDKDTVWSSAYCVSGPQEDSTQVFVSGARKKSILPWDMIPTDKKCNRTADTLEPGEYSLVTKLGEIESKPAKFVVEGSKKKDDQADDEESDKKSSNKDKKDDSGDTPSDDATSDSKSED